ncbi:MAG: response regulator [Defluviitaleaceae bacterium]|nr:response regulator [Defluviitaleaceae bacterium]
MDKKNSILIVDDDSSNLMELFHILRAGYNILTAMDGESALEKAGEFMPDLILLDVIMPGMNGFEVLAKLKRTDAVKSIPVIFITGLNEEGDEREGLAAGAVDYIRKPFNPMVAKLRVSQQIQIINLRRDLERAAAVAEENARVAEAASRYKSTFLANMSHEIRTPLNAVMGVTDILLQIDPLPEEIEAGLEKIYASGEMLLGIINDILDFSKIEAGKLDIVAASYKTVGMINDAVHLNMLRIGNKPITFELAVDEAIPEELLGDELRIKQILSNILSNAFKYTDAGKVTMEVRYETVRDDGNLVIVISDTGRGMSGDQLARLFDEYSRFNENADRSIEGTGLGFSIVKQLVTLMDGELSVESEPGKGTAVTVSLPQGVSGSAVLGKQTAEKLRHLHVNDMKHRRKVKFEREPMPYGRVLVVDDTETNLFVAERFLKLYQLNIETATNGREAVDRVKNGRVYDIIFMDHMMPEMDGMEAASQIRAMGYTNPIVALTANAITGRADVFLQNGFDAFIPKPIDLQLLDDTLNRFVRDRQSNKITPMAAFLNIAREAVITLDAFCKKGDINHRDIRGYTAAVHAVSGALNDIGEKRLSRFAHRLELAGWEGDTEILTRSTPQFIIGLQALMEENEENG